MQMQNIAYRNADACGNHRKGTERNDIYVHKSIADLAILCEMRYVLRINSERARFPRVTISRRLVKSVAQGPLIIDWIMRDRDAFRSRLRGRATILCNRDRERRKPNHRSDFAGGSFDTWRRLIAVKVSYHSRTVF